MKIVLLIVCILAIYLSLRYFWIFTTIDKLHTAIFQYNIDHIGLESLTRISYAEVKMFNSVSKELFTFWYWKPTLFVSSNVYSLLTPYLTKRKVAKQ